MKVATPSAPDAAAGSSFIGRHQFLIYRLFSLAGLMPVGAYLVLHLSTNASVIAGPGVFQEQVDRIHSLGPLLPFVEWTFIFIPILFHGIVGTMIAMGSLPNMSQYQYGSNIRYTFQRVTGMIVAAFILFHIWHLHHLGSALRGGNFDPEHATSSAALAIGTLPMQIIYAVGTLCAVYHLSNGLWTFGITWGIWTSEGAQRRAGYVCTAFGIGLAVIGMTALYGMSTADVAEAEAYEDVKIAEKERVELEVEQRLAEVEDEPADPPESEN